MTSTITLPAHYCGPPQSANGGYTAGALARVIDGPAEVTLRCPPPLDHPLVVTRDRERVLLRLGDELIAEAIPTTLDIDLPRPVTYDVALAASLTSPFRETTIHPFPGCFVCRPNRHKGDGLRLLPGRVPDSDLFAAPWVPNNVDDEILWAALDCPSSAVIYLDDKRPPPHVLGRIAAQIHRPPEPGAEHVIMSWLVDRDGRKVHSASAIYRPDTGVCAIARATWISLQQRA
jgi:hypothetical protein